MTRHRSSPPPRADPGDLSWSRALHGDVEQAMTWQRTDGLTLYLRPADKSFTVAVAFRSLTPADVADTLRVLGLVEADVVATYTRALDQREMKCVAHGERIGEAVARGPGAK